MKKQQPIREHGTGLEAIELKKQRPICEHGTGLKAIGFKRSAHHRLWTGLQAIGLTRSGPAARNGLGLEAIDAIGLKKQRPINGHGTGLEAIGLKGQVITVVAYNPPRQSQPFLTPEDSYKYCALRSSFVSRRQRPRLAGQHRSVVGHRSVMVDVHIHRAITEGNNNNTNNNDDDYDNFTFPIQRLGVFHHHILDNVYPFSRRGI